jgi:hypothetical protein
VLLNENGFCKERFFKRKKEKDKPSEGSEHHVKFLSRS